MKLILPAKFLDRWRAELRKGGNREIGGVLVAEYVGNETFQLAEFSRQKKSGTYSRFVRDEVEARAFVAEYLSKAKIDPTKCNYIGEWHSHPLFSVHPSREDIESMFELSRDTSVGIGFAILIIVKLGFWLPNFQMSCTVFKSDGSTENVIVEVDGEGIELTVLERIRRFLWG